MAASFAMLALLLGRVRTCPPPPASGSWPDCGRRPPDRADLGGEDEIAEVARRFAALEHTFLIGRVRGWPVAAREPRSSRKSPTCTPRPTRPPS